jgi:AraC-like DNA-binding protein
MLAAMLRASVEDYTRGPVGKYVAGRSYIVWIDSTKLAGCALLGRLDEREVPDFVRLTALPDTWAHGAGYDVLVDCGRFEAAAAPSFAEMLGHMQRIATFTTKLRRIAVVRPPGMAGAVVAGVYHEDVRPKYRAALFADRAQALGWLGVTSAPLRRIERMMTTLCEDPAPLGQLRDYFGRSPGATLAGAARALGLSERSLSRRLKELSTTFRAEQQRARVRAAESLLLDTELKVDAVARRIGFASRAHFSEFFHRATGETPSEFRARRT